MNRAVSVVGDILTVVLGVVVALAILAWFTALPTIGALWVLGVLR